jgi:O-antigen/teichoic acid export membrane protein
VTGVEGVLASREMVLVTGSGGVGKTTVAAAMGAATGLASTAVLLGLNRGLARQVAILHELGDGAGMRVAIRRALVLVSVASGALLLLLFATGSERLVAVFDDELEVALLLVLAVLVPIQALDQLFQSLLSAFSSSFALFFRRQLLGPLLRLAAVALVWWLGGGVFALSWGYVVGAVVGLAVCATVLRRIDAPLGRAAPEAAAHAGGLLRLSLPLFTSDLSFVLRSNAPVLILAALRPPAEVADFRAALQLATLNLVVLQSLGLMFTPAAARLFARGDRGGLEDFYWRTTHWTALLTFPVLCVTACFPRESLVLLFGTEYSGAAAVLVALVLGHVVTALFGPNVQLLEAYGRARAILWINVLVSAVSLALYAAAIPRYGALGAAWALAAGFVLQNLAVQGALVASGRVGMLHPHGLRAYASIALGVAAALAFGRLALPLGADLVFVSAVWLVLLRVNARALDLAATFPPLARSALLCRMLGLEPGA